MGKSVPAPIRMDDDPAPKYLNGINDFMYYVDLIKDEKTRDAIIAYFATLKATMDAFHALGQAEIRTAIEAGSYMAWRSIMGAKSEEKTKAYYRLASDIALNAPDCPSDGR